MPNEIIRTRVIQRGRPITETIKVFEGKISSQYKNLNFIKDAVLDHLQQYINSNRQRDVEEHPKKEGKIERFTQRNNLYNTIEAGTKIFNPSPNRYILGIGEKRFLNLHAPYWYIQNYGGKIPPSAIGYFGRGKPPFPGGGREVFHYTGKWKGTNPYTRRKNSFLMIPKKTIRGMHYILEIAKVFNSELTRLHQEFMQNR